MPKNSTNEQMEPAGERRTEKNSLWRWARVLLSSPIFYRLATPLIGLNESFIIICTFITEHYLCPGHWLMFHLTVLLTDRQCAASTGCNRFFPTHIALRGILFWPLLNRYLLLMHSFLLIAMIVILLWNGRAGLDRPE
jgi:hypothetical protein